MQKIFDLTITGFFVIILGTLWLFTTKCYTTPKKFEILISNNENINKENLRTIFQTQEVAYSYLKEYELQYPDCTFSLDKPDMTFKRKWFSVFMD